MTHQPHPPPTRTFCYCQVCLVALFPSDPYLAEGYCRTCGADQAVAAAQILGRSLVRRGR